MIVAAAILPKVPALAAVLFAAGLYMTIAGKKWQRDIDAAKRLFGRDVTRSCGGTLFDLVISVVWIYMLGAMLASAWGYSDEYLALLRAVLLGEG